MDRRNRVWLALLAVLLVAAVVGIVLVNRQLTDSKKTLAALSTEFDSVNEELETMRQAGADAQTQLSEAQAQAADLEAQLSASQSQTADLEAQLSASQSQAADLETQLSASQSQAADLETQLSASQSQAADLEAQLSTAQTAHQDLTDGHQAAQETIAALQAEIAEYQAQIDALKRELEAAQAAPQQSAPEQEAQPAPDSQAQQLDELNVELEAAQAQAEALGEELTQSEATIARLEGEMEALRGQHQSDSDQATEQIEALNRQIDVEKQNAQALSAQVLEAQAQIERLRAQLQAYSLERELGEGEAYSAATQENEISITAGKTAVHWQYVNDARSGNEVVLSLELDGEEIYRSGALMPGETLSDFELNRALEAGEYEAVAVARVYDEAGELCSSTRTPVMLRVQS